MVRRLRAPLAAVWLALTLTGARPAAAHGGEALFCLPFVWALEAYAFCLDGCFAGADVCCCCSAPAVDDRDDDNADEDDDDGVDVVFRPAALRY